MFGQPESYSAILNRIWASSFVVSFLCVLSLPQDNPLRTLLAFIPGRVDAGPIKDVSFADAALSCLLALGLRMTKAHDRLSDVLKIRESFDVRYLLKPLLKGVDLDSQDSEIRACRNALMSRIFYPYAPFTEPKIPVQLVRTAADAWSWYWCTIEAILILMAFAVIHLIAGTDTTTGTLLLITSVFITVAWLLWAYSVTPSAAPQVEAILSNVDRKTEVEAATREIMITCYIDVQD